MVPSILPGSGSPALPSPIEQYVQSIDRPDSGAPVTVYRLRQGCTKLQRMAVLAEIREHFPNVAISMIGDEIAVFGHAPTA
jgi:hypothetical protein